MNQAKMFFKIFLFTINARLFYLQGLGILQLNLCLFKQHLLHHSLEVFINLAHHFDLATFDLFGKVSTLID